MSSMKKQSVKEDQPLVRITREREYVEALKHENETLKLDLNKESRDAKKSHNNFVASDVSRYAHLRDPCLVISR
jgi:hypothetical protein